MNDPNPQAAVLRAIEAGCGLFAAVDSAIGAGLPPHAHSCGLMVRGELAGLIRRLCYIASLVETPEPAIERAKQIHGNEDTENAGAS